MKDKERERDSREEMNLRDNINARNIKIDLERETASKSGVSYRCSCVNLTGWD